jgi:hypothetical protein
MGIRLLLAAVLAGLVPTATAASERETSAPEAPAELSATLEAPLAVADLTGRAAVVVLGEVTAVVTTWNATRDQVMTRVEVKADEVLKGRLPFGSVTIEYAGGTEAGVARQVAGTPAFARGERVLLFLAPGSDGRPGVVGGFQGKFALSRDESGREVAARSVPGSTETLDRVFLTDVRELVVDRLRR